jgi:peptide/nickel transport system ATP-binding protein
MSDALLRTEGLTRHFRLGGMLGGKSLHAVDRVDLTIRRREIVALVGESGSGKSTIARLLAMVYKPTAGEIYFEDRPLSRLRSRRNQLEYRGNVPMVFQDPYSSINPAYRISHGLIRGMKLHRADLDRHQRIEEAERVLTAVGLVPADVVLRKFPYEMSGGQRQRVGLAQALAYRPKLILADEPVSMLDVSIRIGLLNVMSELRQQEDVSFLYITHDIASARYIADRVVVMYAGRIAEEGPTEEVLQHPRHPYTMLLLSAVPDPKETVEVSGSTDASEPPKVVDPKEGCRFQPRCPYAEPECEHVTPELRLLGVEHSAACHLATSSGISGSRVELRREAGQTTPAAQ